MAYLKRDYDAAIGGGEEFGSILDVGARQLLKKSRSFDPQPVTPVKRRAMLATAASLPALPGLLQTPRDSPTNPFGRMRRMTLASSLPPATPYTQHVVLRFQVVAPLNRWTREDVFRLVQVPINYTFTHLRAFIHFVYPELRKAGPETRHFFEVQRDVTMVEEKKGRIASGMLWTKLKGPRNPLEDSDDDAETDGDSWRWEGEEEFTLAHVWALRDPLKTAIVYKHECRGKPPLEMHLSISREITRRHATSNVPHVFKGVRRIHFLEEDAVPSGNSSVLAEERELRGAIVVDHLNAPNAFKKYFEGNAVPSVSRDEVHAEVESDDWMPSTPELTRSSPASLRSSSPIPFPTFQPHTSLSRKSSISFPPFLDNKDMSASTLSLTTPAPPRSVRRRVDSAQRHIEIMKQTPWMRKYDERDSDEEAANQDEGAKGNDDTATDPPDGPTTAGAAREAVDAISSRGNDVNATGGEGDEPDALHEGSDHYIFETPLDGQLEESQVLTPGKDCEAADICEDGGPGASVNNDDDDAEDSQQTPLDHSHIIVPNNTPIYEDDDESSSDIVDLRDDSPEEILEFSDDNATPRYAFG